MKISAPSIRLRDHTFLSFMLRPSLSRIWDIYLAHVFYEFVPINAAGYPTGFTPLTVPLDASSPSSYEVRVSIRRKDFKRPPLLNVLLPWYLRRTRADDRPGLSSSYYFSVLSCACKPVQKTFYGYSTSAYYYVFFPESFSFFFFQADVCFPIEPSAEFPPT